MFIIRLCNHANLQLVFAVFKAVLFCILKEGKATTHHENYAVVFNLYLQGRKKVYLKIIVVVFYMLLRCTAG